MLRWLRIPGNRAGAGPDSGASFPGGSKVEDSPVCARQMAKAGAPGGLGAAEDR